jgi:hypothetical protein
VIDMKTLLLAALLLTAAIAAVPSASAIDETPNPTTCNAVVKDYDGDGQADFAAVGCSSPRGCVYANLDDQQRYCTGRPS